jgi:hypothetical protein
MVQADPLTLDPADQPVVNVHLTAGRWEASCPGCGYVLCWAAEHDVLDCLVTRVAGCPICGGAA